MIDGSFLDWFSESMVIGDEVACFMCCQKVISKTFNHHETSSDPLWARIVNDGLLVAP